MKLRKPKGFKFTHYDFIHDKAYQINPDGSFTDDEQPDKRIIKLNLRAAEGIDCMPIEVMIAKINRFLRWFEMPTRLELSLAYDEEDAANEKPT